MKVPYISASRLKLFEDCQLAYRYRYDPKTSREKALKKLANHPSGSQAAMMGSAVHLALERWREPDAKTGKTPKPRLPALMKHYTEGLTEFPGLTFEFASNGEEMLRRWFDRRGREAIKVLGCEYTIGEQDETDKWKITPHQLECGVPVFGFIDLVIEHRDGTIECIDYKTQWMPISQDEADHSVQAGIYLLYAREMWPGRPLKFSFDLTRYGVTSSYWSDDKLDAFGRWLKSRYELMQKVTDPKPQIGNGCKWCAFAEICPDASSLMDTGDWSRVVSGSWADADEMLDQLATVKAAKAILNRQQKLIEDNIKQDIFDPGAPAEDCVLETDGWNVEWKEAERVEYIPSEIRRLVPAGVFEQMVKSSKTDVERAFKILPEDTVRSIRETAIIKPSRRLSIRKRQADLDDDGTDN